MKPNNQDKSFQQRREELLKSRLVTENGNQSSQYLESLIEDVLLNGESFESQLPIFVAFAENEGLDANQLKNDIIVLLDVFKSVSGQLSNSKKMGIVFQAQRCHISEEVMLRILSDLQEKKEQEQETAKKKAEAEKRAEAERKDREEGVTAIDLGLPSGTKWASCNIGATKPEEPGGYFAWGESEEKNEYNEDTYKWYTWSDTHRYRELTKYCDSTVFGKVDNKWKLDLDDDVAHVKLGGKWRLPTTEQFQELKAHCRSKWMTLNGVEGCRFTSKKNGNSIFFPACGYLSGSDLREHRSLKIGNYWSLYNGPLSTGAGILRLRRSGVDADQFSLLRIYGCSVRPVLNN